MGGETEHEAGDGGPRRSSAASGRDGRLQGGGTNCGEPGRGPRGHAAVIVLAVLAVYFISLGAPFILDDGPNILGNESIRSLWPPWEAVCASEGTGLGGRPLVNLSLAINYAISGPRVWSYHLFNMLVHALAAITLLGVARRLLAVQTPRGSTESRPPAGAIHASATGGRDSVELQGSRTAFVIALLWALHPLATGAVTYTIQRCESMYGLFALLSVYAAIRSRSTTSPARWQGSAIVACLAAVASKESAATIPLLILLIDTLFFTRSPLSAIRTAPRLYGGLAACMGALALLAGTRGWDAAQLADGNHAALPYAWTQCRVVAHYLRLAVWPVDQCLDYGWPLLPLRSAAPCVIAALILLGATLRGLQRRAHLALLPAAFLLLLAPSSSVFPIRDVAFEHRMYLPLICVVATIVLGVRALLRRMPAQAARLGALSLTLFAVLVLGSLTFQRNRLYTSEPALWRDTVRVAPDNPRAWTNLGTSLLLRGHAADALEPYQRAVALAPDYALARAGLGCTLQALGQSAEAVPHLEEALRLSPGNQTARKGLAAARAAGAR